MAERAPTLGDRVDHVRPSEVALQLVLEDYNRRHSASAIFFDIVAQQVSSVSSTIDEPLRSSAPLAHRLASRLCQVDPATGESCAWIHGLWQYLRLMDLASGPAQHGEFFRCAFEAVAGCTTQRPRVLVAGAADYSMLAHALAAFRAYGIDAHFTVVDRCATPLALNRWYAKRQAAAVVTYCCDLRRFSDTAAFDAVCTHSLFSELCPEHRVAVVAQWQRLLRTGGKVIMVNRLRPAGGSQPVAFTGEQARAFRALVEAKLGTLPGKVAGIADEAQRYASRRSAHPVRSAGELQDLFEGAGFEMEQLSRARLGVAAGAHETGPTAPQGAEYARIVASRV
jgi:SAM-dependent methyltransferase